MRRLADAAEGKCTWEMPADVTAWIDAKKETERSAQEAARWEQRGKGNRSDRASTPHDAALPDALSDEAVKEMSRSTVQA